MKLEYTLELDDVVSFSLRHMRQLPEAVRLRKRYRVLVPAIYFVVGCLWAFLLPQHWLVSIFIIILAGLWYRFYDKAWDLKKSKQLKKLFKKNKDLRVGEPQELILQNDCLVARSSSNEARIKWSSIIEMVEEKDSIYLYLTEEDGIIIPRERAGDDVEWDDLRSYLRALL